jgi:flagellar protein FlgJ
MTVADASLYTDFSGFTELKRQARNDQESALKEVARQFEAIFLQQMLKEMRSAKLAEGVFDSSQTQFYEEIYDQQLALHLSRTSGLGLAEVLERQLSQDPRMSGSRAGLDALPLLQRGGQAMPLQGAMQATMPLAQQKTSSSPVVTEEDAPFQGQDDFVRRLRPHAEAAAAKLGVEPEVLIAQAALETGWGKHQMRHGNGGNAHNLFGIKAGNSWSGERVAVSTLEYEDGVAVRKTEPFRAYGSYRESFLDYANLIMSNPRYGRALGVGGDAKAYFRELQKAGYATDPAYAEKLTAIYQRLE